MRTPMGRSTPTQPEGRITPTDRAGTRIAVEVRDGRHTVRSSAGLLRAQRLHGPPDRARVALVGQTALLLGGDRVEIEVEVGPGAMLELSDIAGTVAYHGRGRSASWTMICRLGLRAQLRYSGEPLVVSDGADVRRTLSVDLADGASARLRETVVLGRTGERGGRLDGDVVLRRGPDEFFRERLLLETPTRDRPGVLAGVTVIDSVLDLGSRREGATAPADAPIGCRNSFSARTDVITYELLDPGSSMTRFLGTSLADSPLSG